MLPSSAKCASSAPSESDASSRSAPRCSSTSPMASNRCARIQATRTVEEIRAVWTRAAAIMRARGQMRTCPRARPGSPR